MRRAGFKACGEKNTENFEKEGFGKTKPVEATESGFSKLDVAWGNDWWMLIAGFGSWLKLPWSKEKCEKNLANAGRVELRITSGYNRITGRPRKLFEELLP